MRIAGRVVVVVAWIGCGVMTVSGCADSLYGLGDKEFDDDARWCAERVELGDGIRSEPVDCSAFCHGNDKPGWCSGCSGALLQAPCGDGCCGPGYVCESDQCAMTCAEGRYLVLDPSKDSCDDNDSNLVKDTSTGLIWRRHQSSTGGGMSQAEAVGYCSAKGMRLPTKDEALAIAGTNFDSCAFCNWGTWTTSPSATGQVWYVGRNGGAMSLDVNETGVGITTGSTGDPYYHALCVR